jgi:hypothetical protein
VDKAEELEYAKTNAEEAELRRAHALSRQLRPV